MKRKSDQILIEAMQTLETTQFGLRAMQRGGPSDLMPGFRNVAVFGRAVTNVLQNLRSTEPDFDDWYAPYVEEMKQDPLLRRFYELRTQILKVGTVSTRASTYISSFEFPRDMSRLGPPPPGATTFFIGDSAGGSGWEVPRPDGTTEKYYVELPIDIGSTSIHLSDPPEKHLGEPVRSSNIVSLSVAYVHYLEGLLAAARKRFDRKRGA